MDDFKNKPEKYWKEKLTSDEYYILREKGTEPAFVGLYNDTKEKGVYCCKACGQLLFTSDAKFDSKSGWPSFYEPVANDAIEKKSDTSLGMERAEILCSKCDGHLGHVFSDGPQTLPNGKKSTGLRYCINSVALTLKRKKD